MTPNQKKERLKGRLRERFGDKYLEFMTDLSNVSMSHADIERKWKIVECTVGCWVRVLGYTHTGRIKQKLRGSYRIAKRVRERQETMRQIMGVLTRRVS